MANTVSLDVAKRLKAAGLPQRAEIGDYVYVKYLSTHTLPAEAILVTGDIPSFSTDVFAPALSDILSWLEGMGYEWNVQIPSQEYDIKQVRLFKDYKLVPELFEADTPEDAAGLALIWALGQEGEGHEIPD